MLQWFLGKKLIDKSFSLQLPNVIFWINLRLMIVILNWVHDLGDFVGNNERKINAPLNEVSVSTSALVPSNTFFLEMILLLFIYHPP